jgi:hypothetical protein
LTEVVAQEGALEVGLVRHMRVGAFETINHVLKQRRIHEIEEGHQGRGDHGGCYGYTVRGRRQDAEAPEHDHQAQHRNEQQPIHTRHVDLTCHLARDVLDGKALQQPELHGLVGNGIGPVITAWLAITVAVVVGRNRFGVGKISMAKRKS